MIAGIVLFALGLKTTIEHVDEPLAAVPAVALCGGLALYFFTHVGLRVRLVHFIRRTTAERPGWIGPGRLATGIVMLALIPAALALPALRLSCARDGGLLRAHRLGCHPLPGAPRRGTTSAAVKRSRPSLARPVS